MAESTGSGGGFIVVLVAGVALLWMLTDGGEKPLIDTTSTSTPSVSEGAELGESGSVEYLDVPVAETRLTPPEIESRINDAYREVDRLKEEVADAKLWGVSSPYRGILDLSASTVYETDPDKEYLFLSFNPPSYMTVDITGWTIESTVTGERASVPLGARLPARGRVSETGRIVLEPNDTVYLVTGDSPIGVSFYENRCTGYLDEYQDFYPPLIQACPAPKEEMLSLGNIELDDDRCYRFVDSLRTCRTSDSGDATERISGACQRFVDTYLHYQGCVNAHRAEPYFFSGPWRIYLSRSRELWRTEREILRLLDDSGKTVAILKY